LAERLLKAGYSPPHIHGILGGNYLRRDGSARLKELDLEHHLQSWQACRIM